MLTKKQFDLLLFIQKRTHASGVSPSFDEMKEALGLRSKSGIHRLITALEERGFIRRIPHRARAIEILRLPENMTDAARGQGFRPTVISGSGGETGQKYPSLVDIDTVDEPDNTVSIPLVGRIAAGVPIEAIENKNTSLGIPSMMLSASGEHYALEVKGDSMIDAGIFEGDIVVVRRQEMANNGDIVVALIDSHEATLKRFRRKGTTIALEAANPDYGTRIYRNDQVRIQGKMVGLIRTY